MTTIAIIYLVCAVFAFLPGSALKRPVHINWDGPHVYVAFIGTACAVALAILTLI